MVKLILFIILVIAAIVGRYLYLEHLSTEGYSDHEIHMHIFHKVPLRFLKERDPYSGSPYSKSTPEYQKVEYDDYPSYYGANYDPSTGARRNAPPTDYVHNQQILASGGWQCACGRINASYVSSCSCGRNKSGELPAEPVPISEVVSEEGEIKNAAAIREYKSLMDDGIITPEEFEAKKKQLLGI